MFTATLYNKTGFTLLNIPDSENVLNAAAASTKAVPAMDILQLLYNQKITIRAFENDVMYADYLKLTDDDNHKSAFYVINTYTMTSGDTIELDITMEPILTGGGISALTNADTYIEGTVTRYHPVIKSTIFQKLGDASSEEDPLFKPIYPTRIQYLGRVLNGQYKKSGHSGTAANDFTQNDNAIAMSSIDVDAAKSFKYDIETSSGLETYIDTGLITNDAVNFKVPVLTGGDYETDFNDPSFGNISAYPGKVIPINTKNDMFDFRKDLAGLMANRMASIITDLYLVPASWVSISGAAQGGSIQGFTRGKRIPLSVLTPSFDGADPDLAYIPFIPIDNDSSDLHYVEPYLGAYNELIFVSSASGDKVSVNINDLVTGGEGGVLYAYVMGCADPRPEGGVDFVVATKGSMVHLLQSSISEARIVGSNTVIKGGKWYHMAINGIGSEGAAYNLRQFNAEIANKNFITDVESSFGLESERGTYNPISAVVRSIGNQAEKERINNLYTYGSSDKLSALGEGSDINTGYLNLGAGILAGDDRIKTIALREAERKSEVAQYNNANAPQPKMITSASGDVDMLDHSLLLYKRTLDQKDVNRFSDLLCKFGTRRTGTFQKSYLNNRQLFNYVECNGIIVNVPSLSKEMNTRISDALNGGVRIWHDKPVAWKLTDPDQNPNAT